MKFNCISIEKHFFHKPWKTKQKYNIWNDWYTCLSLKIIQRLNELHRVTSLIFFLARLCVAPPGRKRPSGTLTSQRTRAQSAFTARRINVSSLAYPSFVLYNVTLSSFAYCWASAAKIVSLIQKAFEDDSSQNLNISTTQP